jgi:hypothetical protein
MPPDAVLSTLRHVWAVLERQKVPAALAGGLAMLAWNRARFTSDVDLLIAIGESLRKDVLHELRRSGVRAQAPVVRIGDDKFIQLTYEPPGSLVEIQVDLILATTEFHQQAIDRRVELPRERLGFDAQVVQCEDLIILKLIAGRILDRVDVGELLKANRPELDFVYLTAWIRKLKLYRAFQEAWNDVFAGEPAPQ